MTPEFKPSYPKLPLRRCETGADCWVDAEGFHHGFEKEHLVEWLNTRTTPDKAIEECALTLAKQRYGNNYLKSDLWEFERLLTSHFGSTRKEGDDSCRTTKDPVCSAPKAEQQQVGASPSRSVEEWFDIINIDDDTRAVIEQIQSSSHLDGGIEQVKALKDLIVSRTGCKGDPCERCAQNKYWVTELESLITELEKQRT